MCDGLPDKPSREAAEGTCYHGRSEIAIKTGTAVSTFIGQTFEADGFKFTVNEEDADYAQGYVDRIRARERDGCIVSIEVRADTSGVLGIPGQTGTIDARIYDIAARTLEIRDLKFGRGVKVHVWQEVVGLARWMGVNDQLGIYGASEWERTDGLICDWEFLRLVIDQPRINHYDEITLSRDEVALFIAAVRNDGRWSHSIWKSFHEDAKGLEVHLKPSLDACRWCPRGGSCKVRAERMLEFIK